MLPGFRFLLAAIVLSTSTLIFGLGAAALLRAAHEQFASTPYWHPAADATFTQQAEAARVVLALLRAEPAADEKASDQVIAASAPALPPAEVARSEIAGQSLQEKSPETAGPEPAGLADQSLPGLPQTEAAAPELSPAAASISPDKEVQITEQSATAVAPTENFQGLTQADSAAAPTANAPIFPSVETASIKTASLDSPTAALDSKASAKPAIVKPDQNAIKKRRQARQAALRLSIAAARTRQLKPAPQQAPFPFGQPSIQASGVLTSR
jgi:hypothetical protein